jgi:proteasome accessory factor B
VALMEKLERLLNLAGTLLDAPRPLAVDEVVARVGGYPEGDLAQHRAFERDKEDLRELGIPLSLDEVPGSDPPRQGYWIRGRDYYLRDPGFLADEAAALQLATSLVRVDGDPAASGWWKLGGMVADGGAGGAGGDGAELASLPGDPNVARCYGAITEHRRLTFDYQGERRQVDPFRVEFGRGRWYLVGHDVGRDDERRFRLDRVTGTVATGAPRSAAASSAPATDGADHPWSFGEGEAVRARVLVDGPQAGFAVREVGEEAVVERRGDGSVVLELSVTNPAAFRSFVLSFLEHAEVLSPPELRHDLVAWLEEMR